MKRLFNYAILLIAMVAGFTACEKENPVEYSLQINPKELIMFPGDEEQIKPVLTPAVEGAQYTFKSKDEDVVSVNSRGVVTALKRGDARVEASVVIDGKQYTAKCNITVKEKALELDADSLAIFIGEKVMLEAGMNDGSAATIAWKSSDNKVVTVEDGVVTAVAAGDAVITATCSSNGFDYKAECAVSVSDDLTLTPKTAMLKPGQTCTFTANTSEVTFVSSNEAVATITQAGVATAIAAGTTTISISRGSLKATATLTVEDFTISQTTLSVGEGRMVQLTTNATENETVTWNSSNPSVASVSADGLVEGKSKGTATITATCEGLTATCVVTVKEALKLTKHEANILYGTTVTLTANYPSSDITWSSSSSDLVDNNGVVSTGTTAWWQEGTTTYYVYASYEGMTDSCKMTCYALPKFARYKNGETKTIYYTTTGYGSELDMLSYPDNDFSYSLSHSGIISYEIVSASVPTSGGDFTIIEITPKSTGTVTFTATYTGSVDVLRGLSAYINIKVQ